MRSPLLLVLLFLPNAGSAAADPPGARYGILGAMAREVEDLKGQLTDAKEETVLGVRFSTGRLNGRPVVVANSGVGGVNAGVATALMLDRFRPAGVVFTGIAGGVNPDLGPGDVVIGGKTAHHDFGELGAAGFRAWPTVNPADRKDNPVFFPADPALLAAAERAAKGLELVGVGGRVPKVRTGVIVTGNVFVASAARRDELRKAYQADAAEMEGAAVAQVCWQNKVPCLVVRSLSDDAGEAAGDAYRQFQTAAAGNSARLVAGIVSQLGK